VPYTCYVHHCFVTYDRPQAAFYRFTLLEVPTKLEMRVIVLVLESYGYEIMGSEP